MTCSDGERPCVLLPRDLPKSTFQTFQKVSFSKRSGSALCARARARFVTNPDGSFILQHDCGRTRDARNAYYRYLYTTQVCQGSRTRDVVEWGKKGVLIIQGRFSHVRLCHRKQRDIMWYLVQRVLRLHVLYRCILQFVSFVSEKSMFLKLRIF